MLQSPSTPQPPPNPSKKQGTLWKWTNYLSGWQPRWFVLNSGVLSYYLSPTEVKQGCRGSLKVVSCDLIVHPTDHQRLDIAAPGGSLIYVRAASTAERQQWLIALGSAKQGEVATETAPSQEKLQGEAAKTKMVELHINCQLLITQITSVKSVMAAKDPDVKVLTEMSTQITATCDAFLNTLAECMDLSFNGGPWPASLKPLSSSVRQESSTARKLSRSGHSSSSDVSPGKRLPSNSFSEDDLYTPTVTTPTPSPSHHHTGTPSTSHHHTGTPSHSHTVTTSTPSSSHHHAGTTPAPSTSHHHTVTTSTPSSHSHTVTQTHSSPPPSPTVKHTVATPTMPSNSQSALSMPPHLLGNRNSDLSPPKRVTFEAGKTQQSANEGTETHSSIPGSTESKIGTGMGPTLQADSHSEDSPDLGSPTAQSHAENQVPTEARDDPSHRVSSKPAERSEHVDDSNNSVRSHSRSNSDLFLTPVSSPDPTPPPSPVPSRIGDRIPGGRRSHQFTTFFSKAPEKFEDLVLREDNGIPTADFLACCRAVVPFFDTLSATAFAPVKADINGNIEKLSAKFASNPQLYTTLQAIVLHELQTGTHNTRNSATDALLWLKRAMEFIQVFIAEVSGGEHSLDVAAGKAYSKSLRRFHNWIVRGIFSLAVKAVPYHKDFLVLLGSDGSAESGRAVVEDMAAFAHSLGEIMRILNQFYQKHKLDMPAES